MRGLRGYLKDRFPLETRQLELNMRLLSELVTTAMATKYDTVSYP